MAGFWRIEQIDSLERGNRIHGQSGFSMVEVIVAMLLVAMVISGFVPLYSYIHKNLIMNTITVVAYNLAEQRIEAVKAADYETSQDPTSKYWSGMGTFTSTDANGNIVYGDSQAKGTVVYANPPGQFNHFMQQTYNYLGTPILYTVTTWVNWDPDFSRNSNPGDSSNNNTKSDYKYIKVEVKVTNGAITYADIILATVTTEEASELPAGTCIMVDTYKAWGQTGFFAGAELWGDVQITVSGPATYTVYTDPTNGFAPGEVYLPIATQDAGTYTITATDGDGLMVIPGVTYGSGQSAMLLVNHTVKKYVEVEYPCSLDLSFDDPTAVSGNYSISGIATLTPPVAWNTAGIPAATYSFTNVQNGQSWQWPYNIWPSGPSGGFWTGAYSMTFSNLTNTNGNQYNNVTTLGAGWDGQFDSFNGTGPGSANATVTLTPTPQVLVKQNNSPVNGATVQYYTSNSSSGQWSYGSLSGSQTTNSNGLCYISNLAPSATGANYSCYGIEVNGTHSNNWAFWIDANGYAWPMNQTGSHSQLSTNYEYPFLATY